MTTKLTRLVFSLLWLIIVLLSRFLLWTFLYIWLSLLVNWRRFTLSSSIIVIYLCSFFLSFKTLRINISCNCFFLLLSFNLLIKSSSINFSKQSLQLFHLSWSQLIQILHNSISHKSVQFSHAFISNISHILQLMLYSFHNKLHCCLTLVIRELIFLEHFQQNRILPNYMLIRKYSLFSILSCSWRNRSCHDMKYWLNTELRMLSNCHQGIFC